MPTVTTQLHTIQQKNTQFTLKQKIKTKKLHKNSDTKDGERQA